MSTIKDSVDILIHDTNGPLGTIRNINSYLKRKIQDQSESIQKELFIVQLDGIEQAVKRILGAVDRHYDQLKESKLWQEPLQ